jgi:integrase
MSLQSRKTSSEKRKQLTNNLIESLKVGNTSPIDRKKVKDGQKFFDGSGLYLQISRTGRKVFRYKYYSFIERYENGKPKPKVVTVGHFSKNGNAKDTFTLEQAQAEYKKAMAMLKGERIDPQQALQNEQRELEKEEKRQKSTFKVVSLLWLENQLHFTLSHKNKVLARLEGDCFPIIGDKPIDEVTREEIQKIARVIIDRKAHDTARRVVAWLEKIFDDALFNGLIPSDPTSGIKKRLPKPIRGKFKAVTSPGRLREILLTIDEIPGNIVVRSALKLLPHVFVRQMELRHARWCDFDFTTGLWHLSKAKKRGRSIADANIDQQVKDFIVPLSQQTIKILQDLKPFTAGSEYVFPGQDSLTRPISNMALGIALKRAGITDTTPHGFRSTFKTLCSEIFDVESQITEHMLSHSPETDKYGYFRGSFLAQRRALAQVWSDYIDQLKLGQPGIVGLKKKYIELTEHFKKGG